jgi:MEKHLA domain-containing protein
LAKHAYRRRDMSLAADPTFYELLAGSYSRLVGVSLVPLEFDDASAARWLYEEAPFCVLAHNTDPDPVFIYGNKTAQACFEYTWAELTTLPSRLSAEEPNREERQRLLEGVQRHGFARGYRGLRIAKSGRRFWIEDVTVWQLIDQKGVLHGQAATCRQWRNA